MHMDINIKLAKLVDSHYGRGLIVYHISFPRRFNTHCVPKNSTPNSWHNFVNSYVNS